MKDQPAIDPADRLLTPAEIAVILRINPRTVTRWDLKGRFPPGAVVRTLGGHRRVRESVIRAISEGRTP